MIMRGVGARTVTGSCMKPSSPSTVPLHIMLTDPHSHGGGQVSYVSRLAKAFVERGHRVTIGCRHESVLVDAAQKAGAEVFNRFYYARGFRLRKVTADLRTMFRFLRTDCPDILHVNGSQDHWNAAIANMGMRGPSTVIRTRHNTYPVRDNFVNRKLNIYWTDYQVVVCDDVRRTLAAQPTFYSGRMCTIHNGVDAERFAPDPEARAAMRGTFGYDDDHVVCGIAARLVKAKGHEFLFRALAQARDRCPHLRLLVLGQGVLEEALRALTKELGIADCVTFAGFREDMAACVQAMDLGVQPSIDCDTSSFTLKEEMAAAKPVIASDYGGLKEIVTHGVEGLVVPAGTVEPLAEALVTLAQTPQLRDNMGAAGRARVLRDFTLDICADRTLAVYREAIGIHREHITR